MSNTQGDKIKMRGGIARRSMLSSEPLFDASPAKCKNCGAGECVDCTIARLGTDLENKSISFGAIEQPAIPTPEQLLSDSCTPYLVKNFISDMLRADCVKAANILEVVAQSFAARADRILKGSK